MVRFRGIIGTGVPRTQVGNREWYWGLASGVGLTSGVTKKSE